MAGTHNQLTPHERAVLIEHWGGGDREICTQIMLSHGYTMKQMRDRVNKIKTDLRAAGDDRWKAMYRIKRTDCKSYNPNEIIRDYGVVHAPDIYADTDPRPCWLVINSPRFKVSPTEIRG